MALLENVTGAAIGAKIIVSEQQKALIDNLYSYRTDKVDIKHINRMRIFGLVAVFSPFIFIFLMHSMSSYIKFPEGRENQILMVAIVGWFLWILLGTLVATYITKKYVHYFFIQNPQKEKYYRWNYLVIYEDELEEWKRYIKDHPLQRPSGMVKPVVVKRDTCKVVRTLEKEDLI